METFNKSIERIISEGFAPVSTDSIYEWARKNIILPRAYAIPGPFDVNSSKYLIEPFHAIKNTKTRIIVVSKSIQTGGSLLADISIPWFIVNRPGPIQFSQDTDQMIRDHVQNRLYPMMANCRPLKYILPENDRDFTNSGIRFPNMTLYVNGEKISAFQAKSVMIAILDECHLWDRGRIPEAMARTSAFDRKGSSKKILISQPGEVNDDFDVQYQLGTMEEYHVPCSKCGKFIFPTWRKQRQDGSYYGLMWTDDDKTRPNGKWNIPEVMNTIRFECFHCGHPHLDSVELKEKWNNNGKYVQLNPQGTEEHRSFRWNSIIKDGWSGLVQEFINAKELADKGIRDNLRLFYQKRMSEPHDPNFIQFDGHLKTSVYDVQTDWPEEMARFATIDCQKTHFWINIRSWSAIGSSRQLYFGKGNSDDIRKLLNDFKVPLNCVFVDIGNSEKQEDSGRHLIYEFVDNNKFTGLRGDHWSDERGGYEWTVRRQKIKLFYSQPQTIPNSKNGTWFYNFSPNNCRDILKELRDGNSHEFKCLENQEYKQQMFAEKKMPTKNKFGEVVWGWKNVNNRPNHAWDCEVMQVVASLIHPHIQIIPKP